MKVQVIQLPHDRVHLVITLGEKENRELIKQAYYSDHVSQTILERVAEHYEERFAEDVAEAIDELRAEGIEHA